MFETEEMKKHAHIHILCEFYGDKICRLRSCSRALINEIDLLRIKNRFHFVKKKDHSLNDSVN